MAGLKICLVKVFQGFKYASSSKNVRGLEYGEDANIQGLERVLNMPE